VLKKVVLFAICLCFLIVTIPSYSQEMSADFATAMKHYRQRHFAIAIEQLNRVVEKERQNAAAYYFLGYAHYALDHNQEAQAAFEKTFEADPKFDPRPYFQR